MGTPLHSEEHNKYAEKEQTEERNHGSFCGGAYVEARTSCLRCNDMFCPDAKVAFEWLDHTGNMRGEILIIGSVRCKYEDKRILVNLWWLVIKKKKKVLPLPFLESDI